MSDLRQRFSLDYLVSSNRENQYTDGWNDCKRRILEILSKPIQNTDSSLTEVDKRYIDKIQTEV